MKRPHEDDSSTEDEEHEEADTLPPPEKRVHESDVTVMTAIKDKFAVAGNQVDTELERVKEKYLVSYLKKTIEKLPLSREILDTTEVGEGFEGYLRMFSIAKVCVHSGIELKKMFLAKTFCDALAGFFGICIHNRVIVPYLRNVVSEDLLQNAFHAYQTELSNEDSNTSNELHCVAYYMQTELEKKQPLKLCNPMSNCWAHQTKAAVKYVTSVLTSIASYTSSLNNDKVDYEYIDREDK